MILFVLYQIIILITDFAFEVQTLLNELNYPHIMKLVVIGNTKMTETSLIYATYG